MCISFFLNDAIKSVKLLLNASVFLCMITPVVHIKVMLYFL